MSLMGRLGATLRQMCERKTLLTIATSATAQGCNWSLFVWAVTHDRAAEASLGYFLLPLVNVAIGVLVLRERIDRAQAIAIALALSGLGLLLVDRGGLPWVALGLSLSFGTYGLVRKLVTIGPLEGLTMETLFLAPLALGWIWLQDGAGFARHGLQVDALLVGSAVLTVVPLLFYVAASQRLALTAMGLAFYIGPTMQLLVAVFVFKEPLQQVQLASFALVWVGLGFIIADTLRRYRHARRIPAAGVRESAAQE
jgi:chloramphenicol-sensitive protein RarD